MSDPSALSSTIVALNSPALSGLDLTAVGTDRDTALALTERLNIVTDADTGTGVVLPSSYTIAGSDLPDVIIFNDGGEDIQVYAADSDTIDGVAGDTGVPLTDAKRCAYYCVAPTIWVSAQLGVKSA